MLYLGIDPGFTGAVAVLGGPGTNPTLHDLPVQRVKNSSGKLRGEYMLPALRLIFDVYNNTEMIATIERQGSMPDQSAQSVFTTGFGYGVITGILVGLAIPYQIVHPVTWKGSMLKGLGREKGHARQAAAALFPTVDLGRRKDNGRAEALLIAEYGRRLHVGAVKTS